MPALLRILAAAFLALAPCGAQADVERAEDLARALEDLAAPDAQARRAAELWIARRARLEDFPTLAKAAREGDAEVRLRIGRAIAADERGLGLAARFAGQDDPIVRGLGESAVEELLAAWSDRLFGPPSDARDARRTLRMQDDLEELRERDAAELLRLQLDRPLHEVVDRLARLGSPAVALVVDPDLALEARLPIGGGAGRSVDLTGTWDELLFEVALAYGVQLEVFGLPAPPDGPPPIAYFTRSGLRGARPGAQMIADLCHQFTGSEVGERRAEAARALAATGWPAAVRWLAREVAERDDSAALEGLLFAAARRRVHPSLATPSTVASLAAQADAGYEGRALAGREIALARARAALLALREVPAVGTGGEDLVAEVLRGWEAAGPRGRWWRLCALEGMRPESEAVADLCDAILGAAPGEFEPDVLLQAVRTRAALPRTIPTRSARLGDGALLTAPRTVEGLVELVSGCARIELLPPQGWRGPQALRGEPVERRIALADWYVATANADAAAVLLADLGALPDEWPVLSLDDPIRLVSYQTATLAGVVLGQRATSGDRALVEAALEACGRLTPGREVRLALLAGVLDEGRHAEAFDALAERDDPRALACLVAGPFGAEAQPRLRERANRPTSELDPLENRELVQALLRARAELYAAERDDEARRFRTLGPSLPPRVEWISLFLRERRMPESLPRRP